MPTMSNRRPSPRSCVILLTDRTNDRNVLRMTERTITGEGSFSRGGRNIWGTGGDGRCRKHKFLGDSFSRGEHIVSWFDLEMCSKIIQDGAIIQNTHDFLLAFYSFGAQTSACASISALLCFFLTLAVSITVSAIQ